MFNKMRPFVQRLTILANMKLQLTKQKIFILINQQKQNSVGAVSFLGQGRRCALEGEMSAMLLSAAQFVVPRPAHGY